MKTELKWYKVAFLDIVIYKPKKIQIVGHSDYLTYIKTYRLKNKKYTDENGQAVHLVDIYEDMKQCSKTHKDGKILYE